jgi:plastocyanin
MLWISTVTVPSSFAYEVITVHDGGSIAGIVKFHGTPPVPEPVNISKDQEVCGKKEKVNETLILGENQGIQNVVVSVVNVQEGKRFSQKNAILDQKDCQYTPRILLVPAGGEVSILNNDGILHNIHTYSDKNPTVNKAQPKFKKIIKEKFTVPEIIKVTCDAHSWMSGWLVIEDHPYYTVTDANGRFLLEEIPPGAYNLKTWHETLKEKIQPTQVLPGERSQVAVELVIP